MILKLLLFGAIALFIYRLAGGELPKLGRKKTIKKRKSEEETMVECSKCGTFVSPKESVLVNGKYLCDECA